MLKGIDIQKIFNSQYSSRWQKLENDELWEEIHAERKQNEALIKLSTIKENYVSELVTKNRALQVQLEE